VCIWTDQLPHCEQRTHGPTGGQKSGVSLSELRLAQFTHRKKRTGEKETSKAAEKRTAFLRKEPSFFCSSLLSRYEQNATKKRTESVRATAPTRPNRDAPTDLIW